MSFKKLFEWRVWALWVTLTLMIAFLPALLMKYVTPWFARLPALQETLALIVIILGIIVIGTLTIETLILKI